MLLDENFNINDEIKEFDLKINDLKHTVPCVFLKARNNNIKRIVIYVHGLNGTKNSLRFLSRHLDNAHIIGFDARACGNNKNDATIHFNQYAKDIKKVLVELKKVFIKFDIKNFFLIGESFGSASCILFYKFFQNEVDGIFIWNMPKKIIDVSNSSVMNKFLLAFPLIWSWITNLPTYDYAPSPIEKLSNNKVMIRASELKKDTIKSDNRSILAAWRGNVKAWNFLLSKKFIMNNDTNLVYVSSNEDLLLDKKAVINLEKMIKTNPLKHFAFIKLKMGRHILLYDMPMGNFLLDAIDKFVLINKNNNLNEFEKEIEILKNKFEN